MSVDNPEHSLGETKTCYRDDCDKPAKDGIRCSMHYQRLRKYGDDSITIKTPIGEGLRYFNKMIELETDECILWPYGKRDSGYGELYIRGKTGLVHRLALFHHAGSPPEGKLYALHKPLVCHNRACFNYKHLYWGDDSDNKTDRDIDGATARGEIQGKAKLTQDQVLSIYSDGRLQDAIAADYGIHQANVSAIKVGKSWGWLTKKEHIHKYKRPSSKGYKVE